MLCVVFSTGCRAPQKQANRVSPWQRPEFKPYFMARDPEYWRANQGKSVLVKGVAVQGKMGARLNSERGTVWIDGLSHWPTNVVWKIVRVTGTVVKRHDGPQLSREDLALPPDQQPQGTDPNGKGYPEGSKELHEARKRYLLKDIKYAVIED